MANLLLEGRFAPPPPQKNLVGLILICEKHIMFYFFSFLILPAHPQLLEGMELVTQARNAQHMGILWFLFSL